MTNKSGPPKFMKLARMLMAWPNIPSRLPKLQGNSGAGGP
jgi:hypothetical protein